MNEIAAKHMKRRAIITVMNVMAVMAVFLFGVIFCTGCDDGSEEELGELSGVKAESVEVEYDGDSHGVELIGTETGDVISYSDDGETWQKTEPRYSEPGVYTVYVKVERSGYNAKIIEAKIEIRSAIISGIGAKDMRIVYDGEGHKPVIEGVKPTDSVTYSVDGENFGSDISVKEIGEYTVYYRVERGKAKYTSSCRIEIVPNIIGKYYNEEDAEIIEITEETEYDSNGRGTVNGQEFCAQNDGITVNGKTYNKVPANKKVYKLTINETKEIVIGGEEIEVEIKFDGAGATVTAEGKTVRIPEVNYCESVTNTELVRNYDTSDVYFGLTENAVIELSKREVQEIEILNEYIISDGEEHGIIPITDSTVKVKTESGYTTDIPKYSEPNRYEYEFVFERDGYLPKKLKAELVIYADISGRYISEHSVLTITGTAVRLNNEPTTLEADSEGIKINGEIVTVTDVGLQYGLVAYEKTTESYVMLTVDNDTTAVAIGEVRELRLNIANGSGYIRNAKEPQLLVYEFKTEDAEIEVRLNGESPSYAPDGYIIGVANFIDGFVWVNVVYTE